MTAAQFAADGSHFETIGQESQESYFRRQLGLSLGSVEQGSTACPKNRKYRVDPIP